MVDEPDRPDDERSEADVDAFDDEFDADAFDDELGPTGAVDDADRPGFQPRSGQLPSVVKRTRARYGGGAAGLAAAMLAVRDLLEKPKDDTVVVVESNSDPVDLDGEGVVVPLDGGAVAQAPPQVREPTDPSVAREWVRRQINRRR